MPTTTRLTMNSNNATSGNLDVLNGVLKDVYEPGLTDTIFFDNSFTRLIESRAGNMDASGRRLISAFETQRSAGVGPITEGGSFRDSVPIDAIQGFEWIKYCNMYLELTGPAIATVSNGPGAYVDIVDKHIQTMVRSAKMDVERILLGQEDGRLGLVSAEPSEAATTTISVTGPAFYDTQFMEKGMYVTVRAPDLTTQTDRILATGVSTAHQLSAITKGNKATSTKGTVSIAAAYDSNGTIAANDWVVRKSAYGSINGTYMCLEQNGLMNLVSDGVDHSGDTGGVNESGDNYKKIWNIDRTSNTELASLVYNIGDELDEENLLSVLILAENTNQSKPNLLMVSPRALLKYFLNTRADRRFNTMTAMQWTGGYTGLGIQLGMTQLMLTALPSCPAGFGFLINTNDFAFMRPPGMSGYKWLSKGGNVLTQKESTDSQFATAVDYWQFVCNDPLRQTKLYGITE